MTHTSGSAAQEVVVGPRFSSNTALIALSAIATGMLAFTGLVAAVILLALQFGASQFSPRLLRWLVGRSPAKWALGVSIAAFVYTLLVIGGISSERAGSRIPDLAVESRSCSCSPRSPRRSTSSTPRPRRCASPALPRSSPGRRVSVISATYPDRAEPDCPPHLAEPPRGDPFTVTWIGPSGVVAGIETRGAPRGRDT